MRHICAINSHYGNIAEIVFCDDTFYIVKSTDICLISCTSKHSFVISIAVPKVAKQL